MSLELVNNFNRELKLLLETKLPVSRQRMSQITKAAMKAIKFYKHVVQSVEKLLSKCPTEYKVPGLYVIDAIIRHSRHQYSDKDVFGPRFTRNIVNTFCTVSTGASSSDSSLVIRLLNLWQKNGVFPAELIQSLLDLVADPTNENLSLIASRIAKDLVANNFQKKPARSSGPHIVSIALDGTAGGQSDVEWSINGSGGNHNDPVKQELVGSFPQTKEEINAALSLVASGEDGGLIGSVKQLLNRFQSGEQDAGEQISQLHLLQQKIVEQSALLANGQMMDPEVLGQLHLLMEELTTRAAEDTLFQRRLLDREYTRVERSPGGGQAAAVDRGDWGSESQPSDNTMSLAQPLEDMGLVLKLQQMTETLAQTREIQEELKRSPGYAHDPVDNVPPTNTKFNAKQQVVKCEPDASQEGMEEGELYPEPLSNNGPPSSAVYSGYHQNLDPPSSSSLEYYQTLYPNPVDTAPQPPHDTQHLVQVHPTTVPCVSTGEEQVQHETVSRSTRKRHSSKSSSRSPRRKRSRSEDARRKRKRERDNRRHERKKMGYPPLRDGFVGIMTRTVFIGHLHKQTTEIKLRQELSDFGPIESLNLIPPRGCAFITFQSRTSSHKALYKLDGSTIDNKDVKVAWATNRGIKDRADLLPLFDVNEGCTYIPHDKFPIETTPREALLDGGAVLDEESLSETMREAIKEETERDRQRKEEAEENAKQERLKSEAAAALIPPPPIPLPPFPGMPLLPMMPPHLQGLPPPFMPPPLGPPPNGPGFLHLPPPPPPPMVNATTDSSHGNHLQSEVHSSQPPIPIRLPAICPPQQPDHHDDKVEHSFDNTEEEENMEDYKNDYTNDHAHQFPPGMPPRGPRPPPQNWFRPPRPSRFPPGSDFYPPNPRGADFYPPPRNTGPDFYPPGAPRFRPPPHALGFRPRFNGPRPPMRGRMM